MDGVTYGLLGAAAALLVGALATWRRAPVPARVALTLAIGGAGLAAVRHQMREPTRDPAGPAVQHPTRDRMKRMLDRADACEGGDRDACRAGCDLGHSNSCSRLAGHLEERDPARARALYLEACRGGSGVGCEGAARMFRRGGGGPVDAERAAELFGRARTYHRVHCEQRYAPSCTALAELYRSGLGGPADPGIAADYAHRACQLGVKTACAPP